MTQPAVDQIDQLLLQAVASNDVQAADAQLLVDDSTKMKDKTNSSCCWWKKQTISW